MCYTIAFVSNVQVSYFLGQLFLRLVIIIYYLKLFLSELSFCCQYLVVPSHYKNYLTDQWIN